MITNYRAFAYVVLVVFLATLINCGSGDHEIALPDNDAVPILLQANQSDITIVQGESVILLIDAAFLNDDAKKDVTQLVNWLKQAMY